MTHWIVVQTRPKAEHLAKLHLERQGYDVYLPLAIEHKEPLPVPFFPRYVFADIEPNQGQWRPIEGTRGVSSILKTSDTPSRVPAKVIDLMKAREEAGVIRLKAREKIKTFEPGEALRIHEGPFTGFEGVFERLSGSDAVRILVSIFGGVRSVEAPAEAVAKVA